MIVILTACFLPLVTALTLCGPGVSGRRVSGVSPSGLVDVDRRLRGRGDAEEPELRQRDDVVVSISSSASIGGRGTTRGDRRVGAAAARRRWLLAVPPVVVTTKKMPTPSDARARRSRSRCCAATSSGAHDSRSVPPLGHPRVGADVVAEVEHVLEIRASGSRVDAGACRAIIDGTAARPHPLRRSAACAHGRRLMHLAAASRPADGRAGSAAAVARVGFGPIEIGAAFGSSAALRISSRDAISSPKSVNSSRASSAGDAGPPSVATELLDRVAERLRGVEPAVRIARHRLEQRGAHARRQIGPALADVGDRLLGDRLERQEVGVAMEQPPDREHLVHDDAEREDVAAAVERLAEDLLGRHVRVLALDRAGARPRVRAARLRDAEVEQLHGAVGGTMMFGGDTSRWTTPSSCPSVPRASCAECRPSHAWQMMPATIAEVEHLPGLRQPRHHARQRYPVEVLHRDEPRAGELRRTTCTWQTFLWTSLLARSASSRNIVTKCSSSARCGRIRLSTSTSLRSGRRSGARDRSRPCRRSRASRSADSCRNLARRAGRASPPESSRCLLCPRISRDLSPSCHRPGGPVQTPGPSPGEADIHRHPVGATAYGWHRGHGEASRQTRS